MMNICSSTECSIYDEIFAYQNAIIETGIGLLIEGLCFLGGDGSVPGVDLVWIPEILRRHAQRNCLIRTP